MSKQKRLRRSVFASSDFDFFGLLIWEHTHNNAERKRDESSQVKKVYKPRTKKNDRPVSKQNIYIKERDQFGKVIAS